MYFPPVSEFLQSSVVSLGLRHGSGTCVFANDVSYDEERWDGIWCNDKMKSKQYALVTSNHGSKTNLEDHYTSFDEISIND